MIGFYDYTVVLTFLSVLTSIFGMTQAMDGHFRIAIVCLALSGLLDTFDGKVARTKKTETTIRSSMAFSWTPWQMWSASVYFP